MLFIRVEPAYAIEVQAETPDTFEPTQLKNCTLPRPTFEPTQFNDAIPTLVVQESDDDTTSVLCCVFVTTAIIFVPFIACDLLFGLTPSACTASPSWLPVSYWFIVNGSTGLVAILLMFIAGITGYRSKALLSFVKRSDINECLGFSLNVLANVFTLIWTCLGCVIVWHNNKDIRGNDCNSVYTYANVSLAFRIIACAIILYEVFGKK